MNENHFDVVVLGTGLTESITAAALSKAGFRVAHVDTNPYYGRDEASFSLDEVLQWANRNTSEQEQQSRYSHRSHSESSIVLQSRYYSLSLCPSVIPSVGPIISSLISSGVSKYGGFRLVDSVAVYDSDSRTAKSVPGSKEDVFKSKDISLVDKRRLMRFLTFAISDFEGNKELEGNQDIPFIDFLRTVFTLNDNISIAVVYALAFCVTSSDQTLPALLRLRRYLRSAGRYGSSPFLIGHYGGTGEIAQGFCRAAAVSGAVYILGRPILSITRQESSNNETSYTLSLGDVPDPLICKLLVCSTSLSSYLPMNVNTSPRGREYEFSSEVRIIARCIAIIDVPFVFASADVGDEGTVDNKTIDTGILVFPPGSLQDGSASVAVTVLITGEGAMSAPKGKWVVYISFPLMSANNLPSPQSLLQPYLNATLTLTSQPSPVEPTMTAFFFEHFSSPSAASSGEQNNCLTVQPLFNSRLPDTPDQASLRAEELFWAAVRILKPQQDIDDPDGYVIDSFWPPVTVQDDADEEW
ncbi:hypothetical protein AMATHDRAFT_139131 [Amanita thiersii Skay4041]|uniref:Rab proteins geranylgeranyltransferase n=1 Tax=Amanita thiersii Skay4041 TaxID=703135 RepID=A0A2A9NYB4_9AGAR|nr:hypothetical protein AMATHDRAFT_139131 [Amanita thiersii Skay4041]